MRFSLLPAGAAGVTLLLALACSSNDKAPSGDGQSGGLGGSSAASGGSGVGGSSTGGSGVSGSGTGGTGTPAGNGGTGTGGSAASGGAGASGGSGATGGGAGNGSGGAVNSGGAAGTATNGGQSGTAGGSGAAGASSGGMSSGGMSSGGMSSGGMSSAGSAGSSAYSGMIILADTFDAGGTLDPKWFAYPDYDMTQQPKIDTSRVHSPPNAIKVTSSSSGSFLMNQMGAGFPAPNNRFYTRVWLNFEQATSAISGHAAYLVGGVTKDNAGTELRLGMSSPGSGEMMDLNLQNPSDGGGGEVTRFSNGFTTGGNPGAFTGTGFQYAANRWYCVEALFDGGGSEFRVWVDGTEIMEMHVHDFSANSTPRTMWGPTFNFMKIGGQNFSGTIGNVWYDDVIIGTEQIGCSM
jgi:hypothetical protein